ncbi:MAG TPA: DMP19 family protein [Candidatus Avibacteroides faecavium]|nr:DMP19 family protein [Candidatus Avibacteroides faecavium]
MVVVNDCDLRVAAGEGAAAFLDVVIGAVRDAVGGEPTAEAMAGLNGWQNTLLAYATLRDEVMEGGFVQLVQNGYGPYIFMNPFAKAVRMMGVPRLAALVNKAGKLYRANREDLERERTDEEFMAMYEQYERFDDIQDEFIDSEPDFAGAIAAYVDANIDQFIDEIR